MTESWPEFHDPTVKWGTMEVPKRPRSRLKSSRPGCNFRTSLGIHMRVFITGIAGFVGFHLANHALRQGHDVFGFDGVTSYYDPELKRSRIAILEANDKFGWAEGMLENKTALDDAMRTFVPDVIIHLAAQAGVRYSLEAPLAYVDANLVGTFNVLELARELKPKHLMLASTSSVYGGNEKLPFAESDGSHFPMSLYAATKKATESMSHAYAHLFDIPTTCFRFFTVYGPWGRPDMALFKFVKKIESDEPIDIYGNGQMARDFTYIDDLVEAIGLLAATPPVKGAPVDAPGVEDSLSPVAPWRIVNIAGGTEVPLLEYIEAIERHLGRAAKRNLLPMQPGDVVSTRAEVSLLKALTGYAVRTSIDEGVASFIDWYREYYSTGSTTSAETATN